MTELFNKSSQKIKRRVLRRVMTESEARFWLLLRNRKNCGFKFRRQVSIGRYVVDFYSPKLKLAIEIDGGYHKQKEISQYDKIRQEFIESLGIKVLRFSNKQVLENFDMIIDKITQASKQISPLLTKERGRG